MARRNDLKKSKGKKAPKVQEDEFRRNKDGLPAVLEGTIEGCCNSGLVTAYKWLKAEPKALEIMLAAMKKRLTELLKSEEDYEVARARKIIANHEEIRSLVETL